VALSTTPLGFIPSPPANGLHLGPLFFHAYGLAYVVAVIAAVTIAVRRWEATGGNRELVYEVAMWGFPAGIIGGRLYFLATSWSEVPPHWWGPFAVWDGGLGIWGGIVAGTLAGLWVLRRRGANIPVFMDAAAPALLVGQAIGRVGNYFNQELFGGPTTLPWGLQISPAHRPVGYLQYATFQPTFLYELIWNLLLACALVWLGHHRKIRAPGLFALYVAGYSFARIGEELLRVDPAHHIFGLRLNFYVASILCLAGIAWFIRIQRAGTKSAVGPTIRRGGALLAAGGLLALAGCGQGSRTNSVAASTLFAPNPQSCLELRSLAGCAEELGRRPRSNPDA
jgi:prolipoprotein diacylglyceryl transferase